MFCSGVQGCYPRFAVGAALSAALGSTFVLWALHGWWKNRRKAEGDEMLFDDLAESPLFDSNMGFSAKATAANKEVDSNSNLVGGAILSIGDRKKALQLAHSLLQKLKGDGHCDMEDSADESIDSEETNVPLNYYIATEMEREARNSLVEAVTGGNLLKMEEQGKKLRLSDYADVLVKVVEYLGISNDREKLRERLMALRSERTENNKVCGAGTTDEGAYNKRVSERVAAINETYADYFSRTTEMDQRLCAFNDESCNDHERFEVDWGADNDSGNEDDLMAYLDRDDTEGYGSKLEARLGAAWGQDLRMMDTDSGMEFEGSGDGYVDEIDGEDEEDFDGFQKGDFERMLIDRLQRLAAFFEQENLNVEDAANFKGWQYDTSALERQGSTFEGEWETESHECD